MPIVRAAKLSYHHGDLRNALMQAALNALHTQGSAEFSLSEMARSLGVTPAAAYKHFAGREALIQALAQFGFGELTAAFEAATPRDARCTSAKMAIARMEALGQAYVNFGARAPELFHVMFGAAGRNFRQQAMQGKNESSSFAYLVRALEDLHRFEQIGARPSRQDQWFAWCAIHGATELAIAGTTDLVDAQHAGALIARRVISALA